MSEEIDLATRLCTVRTVASHDRMRTYELTPAILLQPSAAHAAAIADICNEPTVYGMLFAELLGGRPYAPGDAESFLAWAEDGWEKGSHFVYLLLDERSRIRGAIDIKSAEQASAEIGYWLSASASGVMTNAVVELCDVAREAGYAALHALVRPENGRSARVLARAGFVRGDDVTRTGRSYHRYDRSLDERSPNERSLRR